MLGTGYAEAAQIYTVSGTTVTFVQTLLATSSGSTNLGYGMSVTVNSNYVQVGAPYSSKHTSR